MAGMKGTKGKGYVKSNSNTKGLVTTPMQMTTKKGYGGKK